MKESSISSSFNKIVIGLASPETVLEHSRGQVLKPETINHRTHKAEPYGLFCERIFGPMKNWECYCGKYKRMRYRGIVCDRCGVEITERRVRKERMGHIELVVPIVHVWYIRSLPNKIAALLDISTKKLDQIVYYDKYIVIQPGAAESLGIKKMDFMSENEYLDILDRLPEDNQSLPQRR